MCDELKVEVKKEVIDLAARIREGNGLEGIDFDEVELIRGETPKDIEEKCVHLCQQYLSGIWTQQTIDTIEVKRITGGLTNQIYFCGLKQHNPHEKVPQEVAIKFYGQTRPLVSDNESEHYLNQLVISLLFSERNIGPKIYGVFDGGMIQKFYQHRLYRSTETDSKLIEKVFRTLARIHSMDVPIKRNGDIIDGIQKIYIERSDELKGIENIEIFKKNDLKTEFNWFKAIIERLNSPIVFCHNDYRSGNLLITEPNDELVVCDFDSSRYNYRGSDFAFMMREWNKKHFLESFTTIEDIPLADQMKPHIQIYVEECQQIYGNSFTDNEDNSAQHILKEAKVFTMFTYLYYMCSHLKGLPEDMAREGIEDMNNNHSILSRHKLHMQLENEYKNYHKIKDILNKQNLFDDI